MSDFLLNLRRSLAHKGFAKILDISAGMPAVFANPYASRSQHISSQKIAQLRFKYDYVLILNPIFTSQFISDMLRRSFLTKRPDQLFYLVDLYFGKRHFLFPLVHNGSSFKGLQKSQ
ncbi:MAG: hypothetical protein K8R28_00330 [Desulfobacterales bacterium]|nr:hypothetical protein [Desulfobacterales bacterium]